MSALCVNPIIKEMAKISISELQLSSPEDCHPNWVHGPPVGFESKGPHAAIAEVRVMRMSRKALKPVKLPIAEESKSPPAERTCHRTRGHVHLKSIPSPSTRFLPDKDLGDR